MIVLTRLNGTRYGINDEQIERLEDGPNTVIVLVNGNKYTALESIDEVIGAIVGFRSRVLDTSSLTDPELHPEPEAHQQAALSLFRNHSVVSEDHMFVANVEQSTKEDKKPSLLDAFRPSKKLEDKQ